jgi:glycosyltransferase involved in cell wall biosynthesis
VIENGYDEETFEGLGDGNREPLVPGAKTLVHSGIVYPSERDPTQFFQALRRMLDTGTLRVSELRVRLRASANEQLLAPMIERHGLRDVVELAPPIPYREALREMLRADGLLLLQASNCNEQIPAKLYEYLRCARPILGLTDPRGDTASALRQAGVETLAPLDAPDDIARELRAFLDGLHAGTAQLPDAMAAKSATRKRRAEALAGLLERVS